MRRRALAAFATGAVLIGLTALTLNATLTLRPLPAIDGHFRFLGLHERAEVARDGFGVPRIEANNAHDLFFLQGYVTAQDRFAQMEAMRGELRGVPLVAPLDDRTVAALDAYAAGVNKWITQHSEARALPAEIALRGTALRPWTADDSVRVAVVQPAWPFITCVAVGPDDTVRGAALLAAELISTAPAPGWYEIGLESPGLRGIGISLPGVPGVLAGHNGRVAWSIHRPESDVVSASVAALVAESVADLAVAGGCAADSHGKVVSFPSLVERPLDVEDMRLRLGPPRLRASSARIVIDLGDLDASRAALSTGQSGHPAARHYGDQRQLWEAGQLHRLAWTRERIARVEGVLVLRPR